MRKRAVITSFSCEADKIPIIDEISEMADKEHITFSKLVITALEEHIKRHGDGNPVFTLDQFEKDFKVTPAVFRDRETWEKYYESVKTPKEYRELEEQINIIIKVHNQNFKRFNS